MLHMIPKSTARAVNTLVQACLVPLFLLSFAPVGAEVQPLSGHWEGTLEFRGDTMPVRIHLAAGEAGPVATLDLPGLLMAWEPLPVEMNGHEVTFEFPFGLGGVTVSLEGGSAAASKYLGKDLLMLGLVRSEAHPFTREDVTFMSGDVELAGTLVLPRGAGPHPAAVLVHGSGRQGRDKWEYRSWADPLVREGLAVLYYDKRGVGNSEGEFEADLRRMADDGIAAVRYLRTRPEVDPGRIGLKGTSQGAWLAEQVAADLGDVAFLLLVSAAAGTPRDQELRKIEYGMRADGMGEAEIEDALAYAGLYFYVARTGEGWPLLEEAIRGAQEEPWGQYVDQPTTAADLDWWRRNHAFQPATVVGGMDLPVLLLYGGADWITPPLENAEKLRSLFAEPDRVEVHAFAGADHLLQLDAGPDETGAWRWPRVASEMSGIIHEWLETNDLN